MPRDQGVLLGLIWDLILFVFIISVRRVARFTGQDEFIESSDDLRLQPRYVDDDPENAQ